MHLLDWREAQWQDFFGREQWVFGYGLDYRMMRQFDREMTVGGGGTDNKNKPVIDFLMSFTDYTVLVEIKTPDTPIFTASRRGRAGTWEFSREFMSAVSQIIEQKAEWLSFAQTGEHHNRAGTNRPARSCTHVVGTCRSAARSTSRTPFRVYSANLGAAVMRRTFVRPRSEENNEWRMIIAPR
jgi:hypothetical protein